jgi:hypothetical protein
MYFEEHLSVEKVQEKYVYAPLAGLFFERVLFITML